MLGVFQQPALGRQAPAGARPHRGWRPGIRAFQRKLARCVSGDEAAVSALRSHAFDTVIEERAYPQVYAVDARRLQQGLGRQMDIFHPEVFGTRHQTPTGGIASVQYPTANPKDAVLDEVDTGFELVIPADENGSHSGKSGGVGSDEIFRIGGEVVLLTAPQTELMDLLEERLASTVAAGVGGLRSSDGGSSVRLMR